jgi:hypothetical protein
MISNAANKNRKAFEINYTQQPLIFQWRPPLTFPSPLRGEVWVRGIKIRDAFHKWVVLSVEKRQNKKTMR